MIYNKWRKTEVALSADDPVSCCEWPSCSVWIASGFATSKTFSIHTSVAPKSQVSEQAEAKYTCTENLAVTNY